MIRHAGIGLMILIGGVTAARAQSCTINLEGKVLDRATLEPLGFTTVGLTELSAGMVADSNGNFVLQGLCPGDFHLQAHHLGCDPVSVFIRLRRDTAITIWLDHHAEMLREIRVEDAGATGQVAQNQQWINEGQLRQDAGRPLSEILTRVAGVRSIRTGSGIAKPVIHGLTGNRVAVINNGVLQAGQQWGADHAPEIDPNGAQRIRVIKGSDAIEFGSRALGGAVLVESGPIPRDPHLHGTTGYAYETNGRMHSLYSRLRQFAGPLAWRMTGTLKRGGDTRAPAYFLTNTGVAEANASLQLHYAPADRLQHDLYYSLFSTQLGILSGAHISNLTDLEEALRREVPFGTRDSFSYAIQPPNQRVAHHLLRYSGKRFRSAENYWSWAYALQRNHRREFDIRRGDRSEIPALDLSLWAQTAEVHLVHGEGRFPFRIGFQGSFTDNSNAYDTGVLPLIPDYREWVAGIYGVLHRRIGSVMIEGGARCDIQYSKAWTISNDLPRRVDIRQNRFGDIAMSAGIVIPKGAAETRLHQSVVIRAPDINELYSNGLHQGVAGIEEGDPSLQPETGIKTTLSQTLDIDKVLHLEIGLFSHFIEDYIYLEPQEELRLTIRGAFPVYAYRQQDAWLRGLDVVAVTDIRDRWTWTTKFSWMRAAAPKTGTPFPLIPPLQWSNTLTLSLPDGDDRKGTRFQVEWEYTAAQTFWDAATELVAPPQGYFLVNLRADTGWRLGAEKNLFAGLAVDNLFNIRYRNYLNRLRYFADETGLNGQMRIRLDF